MHAAAAVLAGMDWRTFVGLTEAHPFLVRKVLAHTVLGHVEDAHTAST